MKIERHAWRSPETGCDMHVVRFGDWGPALVYVPTSEGDHREFERYRMPADCAPWIESGRVQVFSVDGFGPRTLFDPMRTPVERIRGYVRFERWASREMLPWVLSVARNPYLGVVGASYGAFVAANLYFKNPGLVRVGCGLGGVYAMDHRLDGYHDADVASHTPLEYLARLEDRAVLEALDTAEGFHVMGAQDDPWLFHTHRLAEVLSRKGLRHRVDVWRSPADHHERWWKGQIRVFLERAYGPEAG